MRKGEKEDLTQRAQRAQRKPGEKLSLPFSVCSVPSVLKIFPEFAGKRRLTA
jgi:hypothetical protein